VDATERRTEVDWAHQIKELVDERHPQAERIVLVMDNLNTHTPASLYEAFDPEEARRLAEKLEIRYTPKHGSWLNMAEIELSVLSRQCLDIGECPTSRASRQKRALGRSGETPQAIRSTGVSPQKMPASSSSDCILRFRSNRALERVMNLLRNGLGRRETEDRR
jgi:transposase